MWSLFDHVTIRVSDRAASERFYRTVLAALGYRAAAGDGEFVEWSDFSLAAGPEPTTRLHLGFAAASRELVDLFWRTGVEAGHPSDGEPGLRPQYRDDYYGAFLLDPDGNSVEAVHHGRLRRDGVVDHLWIRVADLEASRRFYSLVGFEEERALADPSRVLFSNGNGSFSVVDDGRPARNVHLAFPAAGDDAVDRFHERMIAAGHRDNGGPGERLAYHPGYYAAFVLDPDGNNVELVNHNR
jgi:catechol 2,3-dioxygenase-like lactoylglutathione lyase family enzyme